MIYKSEFEPEVPKEIQQKHKSSFTKMNEAKFINKVLLISLIPWVWMCFLSFVLISYLDNKTDNFEPEYSADILDQTSDYIGKLANSGNVYALLYLAEKGNTQQRDKALSELKNINTIEVNYFNDVILDRTSDLPINDLKGNHQYVTKLISYAKLGYARAIDDLIALETDILKSNNISSSEKLILKKIQSFKNDLKN